MDQLQPLVLVVQKDMRMRNERSEARKENPLNEEQNKNKNQNQNHTELKNRKGETTTK